MKHLFTLLALAFPCLLHATTYYVSSASGNNANPGTQTQPWETIQYGIDQAQPGDTIWVGGGVYSEKVSFNNSGTPSAFTTLYGDPGNPPAIDGTALSPNGREGLLTIADQSYLEVNNFEIRDFATATSNTPVGILVTGAAHDLRIRNCEVHHIAHFAASNSEGANGIGVYGTDATTAIHNLYLSDCEVRDCNTLASEAFVLNGNVRDFQLFRNSVHDCDNIAFDFIGWEGECAGCTGTGGTNADRARNGIVKQCSAWNIDTKDNPNPDYGGERSAAGFYVDGGSRIIFEQNTAYNCNFGFELASEHFGQSTDSIIVRNNLIYNNHVLGIATGGYSSGSGGGGGSAENCFIVNNTFFNNHTSTRPEDDFGGEIYLQNRNINNVYKNNIVFAAPNHARVEEDGTLNTGNVFGTNLYHGSTLGTTPGQVVAADPLFLNAANANFKLANGSPAVNMGENLPTDQMGAEDFDGAMRVVGNVVDLGAFEKGSTSVEALEAEMEVAGPRLYPNPVGAHCWVELRGRVEQLWWLDALGRKMEAKWQPWSPELLRVETADLGRGLHWLVVETKDKSEVIRVVK